MAYEQELEKTRFDNAWLLGGRMMRLNEIRQLAKLNGFKIRTTTREVTKRKSITDKVFVVFTDSEAARNNPTALLWKLGQEPTVVPEKAPTRKETKYEYKCPNGDLRFINANQHNRLQASLTKQRHGKRSSLKSLTWKDGQKIEAKDFTGISKVVDREIARVS